MFETIFSIPKSIGDHPFITRYPSDVNFGAALIMDEKALGEVALQPPLRLDLVRLIAEKTIGHPAVPEEVEDMVRADWGL